jgi:small-conductance mechanosensitive channel
MFFRTVFISIITSFYLVSAFAALEPQAIQSGDVEKKVNALESVLKKQNPGEDEINKWVKEITTILSTVDDRISDLDNQIKKSEQDIASIGEKQKGESTTVTERRLELAREKAKLESTRAAFRVVQMRAQDYSKALTEKQRQLLAATMFARGPTIGKVLSNSWDNRSEWATEIRSFVLNDIGIKGLTYTDYVVLIFSILCMTWIGKRVARLTLLWVQNRSWADHFSSHLGRAILLSMSRYSPAILASLAIAVYMYFQYGDEGISRFLNIVSYGLPILFLMIAIIDVFLMPHKTEGPLFSTLEPVAKSLRIRLITLLTLLFIGYLVFTTILTRSLPEDVLLITRGVFALLFIINLTWAFLLFGKVRRYSIGVRLLVSLLLIASMLAELTGYRNLSASILRAFFGVLIAFGLYRLFTQLFRDFFDGLETGTSSWNRRIRQAVGVVPNENMSGIFWVRLSISFALTIAFAYSVLRVFGFSETVVIRTNTLIMDGFDIGTLHIVPIKLLLAIFIFAALYLFSDWFKTRLDKKWLARSGMERGAREAVVTILGYGGAAIALLVSLSIAGVTFTNLAIIAGALSVGIGFGLQNIVNNFVSGLILLFERPVKTGDWIVVGNTEGYVRRIRIRSTLIQTFDRADVIIPNSELISSQVTNWMLSDEYGRVKVPVGVAYGSDTAKVKEILLEVAHQHPDIIQDNNLLPIRVLFLAFGDSSLNFEVRAFIKNVDRRLNVLSELNFAIDAAFRREGIEIPFPQRDINFRNVLLTDQDRNKNNDEKK